MPNESNLEVFPNPFSDILNLKLPGSPSRIELFTLDGKRLLLLNTDELQVKTDMDIFEKSTYLLKIVTANQIHTNLIVII